MTDQELADRVHNATRALRDAWVEAQDAGLDVAVGSFDRGPELRAWVYRVIPATQIEYPPSTRTYHQ